MQLVLLLHSMLAYLDKVSVAYRLHLVSLNNKLQNHGLVLAAAALLAHLFISWYCRQITAAPPILMGVGAVLHMLVAIKGKYYILAIYLSAYLSILSTMLSAILLGAIYIEVRINV